MSLDKKYFKSRIAKSWYQSLTLCMRYDMDAVTFNTKNEYDHFTRLLDDDFAFTGLSDIVAEGTFRNYIGLETVASPFLKWIAGEPNNLGDEDCVYVGRDGSNDVSCDLLTNVVCERKISKEPATIVERSIAPEPAFDKFDYILSSGWFSFYKKKIFY